MLNKCKNTLQSCPKLFGGSPSSIPLCSLEYLNFFLPLLSSFWIISSVCSCNWLNKALKNCSGLKGLLFQQVLRSWGRSLPRLLVEQVMDKVIGKQLTKQSKFWLCAALWTMGSSLTFTPGEMGSPWSALSRRLASGLYFKRIWLYLNRILLGTLRSENDGNISREVMIVARAREGYSENRLDSDCFEGRTC